MHLPTTGNEVDINNPDLTYTKDDLYISTTSSKLIKDRSLNSQDNQLSHVIFPEKYKKGNILLNMA
jgi:hypothetical protein